MRMPVERVEELAPEAPARQMRKLTRCLLHSVLPAPDSPATSSDWLCVLVTMCVYAISAVA